jgi:hypothetical protein
MSKDNDNPVKYYKEYRIYKPKQTGDGAASALQMRTQPTPYGDNHIVFWKVTRQTGVDDKKNASFAWKDDSKTISIKLEEVDIAEILALLNGQKAGLGMPDGKGGFKGLYHQSDRSNTIFTLNKLAGKDGQLPAYALRISTKRKDAKEALVIQHMLNLGELEVLKVLLTRALARMYGW